MDREDRDKAEKDAERDELEDLEVSEQQAEDVRGGRKKLRGRGRGEPLGRHRGPSPPRRLPTLVSSGGFLPSVGRSRRRTMRGCRRRRWPTRSTT